MSKGNTHRSASVVDLGSVRGWGRAEEVVRRHRTRGRVLDLGHFRATGQALPMGPAGNRRMGDPQPGGEIAERRLGRREVIAKAHAALYHIGTNGEAEICATLAEDRSVPHWHNEAMYPANRIREIREAQGLTLEQLAERANTSHTQISRLETGKRRLDLNWMDRLAKALTCDPKDLLVARELPPDLAELAAIAADMTEEQRASWIAMAPLIKAASGKPTPKKRAQARRKVAAGG